MTRYGIKYEKQNVNAMRMDANSMNSPMDGNRSGLDGSRVGSAPTRGYGMRESFKQDALHAQDVNTKMYGISGIGHSESNTPSQNASVQAPVTPNAKPKKSRVGMWVAIIIAIICVILAAILALTMLGNGKGARQGDAGQLANKTDQEIQAELDRVVEEGMFNISIASTVQFADGESEGELRIENVPGNHYLMRVEITRDDTGEVIYTTDFIEPNHHIQSDTLDVDLPAGEYDCTATFFAYDEETEELIGQAAAKVDVGVLG